MELLTRQRRRWERTALSDDAPVPFPPDCDRAAGSPALLIGAPQGCAKPPACLIVPPSPARLYLNADPRPCLPVTALQPRDRITLHLPTGEVVRAWLLAPGPNFYQLTCGYCAAPLDADAPEGASVEGALICPACGETVHADCAVHYAATAPDPNARPCPRCGSLLLPDPRDWRPDGFKEDADDDSRDD